ncbi:UNVERIFIED_CONTAM: hypothetical protein K2H54_025418 [Gekko kuhli]
MWEGFCEAVLKLQAGAPEDSPCIIMGMNYVVSACKTSDPALLTSALTAPRMQEEESVVLPHPICTQGTGRPPVAISQGKRAIWQPQMEAQWGHSVFFFFLTV